MTAATLAGALAGGLLGWAGRLTPSPGRVGFVCTLAAAGALFAVVGGVAGVRLLPQVDRETEQRLLHHGPLRWAMENGALLGLGFASRLGTWLWYAVPVAAFATGSPAEGAIVYAVYGGVRLLVPSVLAALSVRHMTIDVAAAILPLRAGAVRLADSLFVLVCVGALMVAR